jgi:spore germination protein GerM
LKKMRWIFFFGMLCWGLLFLGCTRGVEPKGEVKDWDLAKEDANNMATVSNENVTHLEQEIEEKASIYEIYFVKVTDTSFSLEGEKRNLVKPSPSMLMAELLKGPSTKELSRILPEGTRLNSVEVASQIAYVDFSQEMTQGNFGSEAEMLAIYSIVKTLKQLPEIQAVQILIEGERTDTLWGHADIREPIL